MKILVSINYSEIMNLQTLQPLVECEKVDKVFIDHNWNIPNLPKVESYDASKWLYELSPLKKTMYDVPKWFFKNTIKMIRMLYLTITKKPDVIVGFYIFPQGLHAFICGKIFRKPAIVYIDDWPGIWPLRRKLIAIPMLKHCDIVATTGTKNKEYLTKQGINENKIYILPDSIDIKRFKPISLPKKYDIIFVGRLMPAKRVDTLLKVIARVKELKDDIKAGIVGDGPLRSSLEELADKLGIAKNVEFLGYKNNPELYYNSAKVFVLTSYYEGLPMAMLEAMACGIPCVVSNVGDVTDAAINGVNAIVIDDPYDINGFSNAIIQLLNDDGLYKKLSENTKIVREKYCYESATKAWNEILDSIKC